MVKPWKEYRREISRLYIREGLTLTEVRTIMRERYDFQASIRSYRQHFDQWNLQKYNCKKRHERRQSQGMLPSPPQTPHLTQMPPVVTQYTDDEPFQARQERESLATTTPSPGHAPYATHYFFEGPETSSHEHGRGSVGQQRFIPSGAVQYRQRRLPQEGGYEKLAILPSDAWYPVNSSETESSMDGSLSSLFDQSKLPSRMSMSGGHFQGDTPEIRYQMVQTPILG